jgi:PAS domain S-box-containing protein
MASELWRATQTDGRKVLIQFPREGQDPERLRESYLRELEVLRASDISARLPDAEYRDSGGPCLVYGNVEGCLPLAKLIERGEFQDLETFLPAAISLAHAVGELHEAGYSHNALSTSSVLCTTDGQCLLTDLGRASSLPESGPSDLSQLIGNTDAMAHVSPEQTGRINRGVDYRSDLYSLGVLLFHMLTGSYPLRAEDTVGWMHAHIALPPTLLEKVRPDLPEALSEIISSLLRKNAEDRCQNAFLVAEDLESIAGGKAPREQRDDNSGRFVLSPAVYGRSEETASLNRCFERAMQGNLELVCVMGESGVGKTALVQETHRPLVEKSGLACSGKFEHFGRVTPHSAILQALEDLASQLLGLPEPGRAELVETLERELAHNLAVVVDRVPALQMLVGDQTRALPAGLESADAQTRFHNAVIEFLRVIASADRPLLLILDDLQWSDLSSLLLLEEVCSSDLRHFMLIGCFRDNEVTPAHPLAAMRRRLVSRSEEIKVNPLNLEAISSLLRDSFRCPEETVAALASLIMGKTSGTPFFVRQFLAALYDDGAVRYSFKERRWIIDLELAEEHVATENVVELMVRRIQGLDEELQGVLAKASLIGARFDLLALSELCQKKPHETHNLIVVALQTGLLISLGSGRRLTELGETGQELIDEQASTIRYQFSHDRVQQAAHSLIPAGREGHYHLRLARFLRKQSGEQLDARDYAIANHYNDALGCITEEEDLLEVVRSNLQAAQIAKESGAHLTMLMHAETAVSLLSRTQADRSLALRAHRLLGRAFMLTGDGEAAKASYAEARLLCEGVLERLSVNALRMELNVAHGEMHKALELLVAMLNDLGVPLNGENVAKMAAEAPQRILKARRGRSAEEILAAPPMTGPLDLALVSLVGRAIDTAFMNGRDWVIAITSAAVCRSLDRGPVASSSISFATYGLSDAEPDGVEGFRLRYEYGLIGRKIAERFGAPSWISGTNVSNPHFYGMSFEQARARFDYAATVAWESSSLTWLHYAKVRSLFMSLTLSVPLGELEERSQEGIESAGRAQRIVSMVCMESLHAFADGLIRESPHPWLLGGKRKSELETPVQMMGPWAACKFYSLQQFLAIIWRRYDVAREAMNALRPIMHAMQGMSHEPLHYLFTAIVLVEEGAQAGDKRLEELHRYFAAHAQLNGDYLVYQHFVKALQLKCASRPAMAMEELQLAIDEARERGFGHLGALANEEAAAIADGRGREALRNFHLGEAADAYEAWGAGAKAQSLRQRIAPLQPGSKTPARDAGGGLLEVADAESLLKACRAISSEIRLDVLLQSLMRTVVENVGAQHGLLMLEERGKLLSRAETEFDGEMRTRLLHSQMSPDDPRWPLIERVWRSQSEVIVDGGASENSGDSPSILCTPITTTRGLVGLLYLENRSLPGAFSKGGNVLEFLLAQVGISLENAKLYESLAGENQQRISAQRVLRLERDYSRQIIESSPLVVCIVDPAGVIRFANRDATRISGLTRELLQGSSWSHVFAPQASREPGEEDAREATFTDRRGEPHTIAWSTVVHRDEEGAAIETLYFGIDLTEVRDAEAERSRLQSKLLDAQRLETVGTLAAGVAHDFNNVLVPILACGSLIKMIGESEKIKELSEDIMRAAERGASLAEQLLLASRKSTPKTAPMLLQETVSEVMRLLRASAPSSIELRTHIQENCPTMIADAGQLHQVLLNLCTNAVHAVSEESRGIVEVSLRALEGNSGECPGSCKEPCVFVTVKDNGHGIDEETQKRIFDPFFTTKGVGEGTGLGLWGAHQIVTAHGGSIGVHSEVGVGTEFRLCLPRSADSHQPALPRAEPPDVSGSESVLFIEDEADTARIIADVLRMQGYDVHVFISPTLALEAFKKQPEQYDLVITDFTMPGMRGTKLCAELHAIRPELPAVMVSGVADVLSDEELRESGVSELLGKPLTGLDYAAAIRRVARKP